MALHTRNPSTWKIRSLKLSAQPSLIIVPQATEMQSQQTRWTGTEEHQRLIFNTYAHKHKHTCIHKETLTCKTHIAAKRILILLILCSTLIYQIFNLLSLSFLAVQKLSYTSPHHHHRCRCPSSF